MKYVCTVCGWSTEADKAPERCPLCGATTFKEIGGGVHPHPPARPAPS